jgi:hypothetical protein
VRTLFLLLAALLAASGFHACSKEKARSALYESIRFKSNEVNALNPNYDADAVPPYSEYEAQRGQHFESEKEGQESPEANPNNGGD